MKATLIQQLCEAAKVNLKAAYSPYSHIKVGAAVLGEDGLIYGGCNVENASYGATLCAERTAVVKAVSEGNTKILAIAVATEAKKPWPPCGMCRQVLLEFANPQTPVILVSTKSRTKKKFTLGNLCPEAFTPTKLR